MTTEQKERIQDYASLLEAYNMPYRLSGPCYLVGELQQSQGWILHVTIVVSQAYTLLKKILPFLHTHKCTFKVIRDKPSLMALHAGYEGYNRIGKVISIYPESEQAALMLSGRLLTLLRGLKGPAVMTDFHLGGILYTRYGSFIANNLNLEYGLPHTIISDGYGNPFYDQYTMPPAIPDGIPNPFEALLQQPKYQDTDKPLHNKYRIKKAIAITVKGNTLIAGIKDGFFTRECIIKQGRENMVADDAGRDIKDRLKWQLEVHRQLQNDLPIPKVYEYFESEGDGYLSMEFIQGINLNYFILNNYRQTLWPVLPIFRRKQLLYVLKQAVNVIKKMHIKGFIHRDINSNNFIVRKNKTICLIDLELAWSFLTRNPDPPFESVTIGYGSAEQMALMMPSTEDDVYSIGALMILFFTGLEPMLIIEPDTTHLEEKLIFLTGNSEITRLILQSIDPMPARRPSLYHILSGIQKIENDTKFIKQKELKTIPKPNSRELQQTIWEALNGLMDAYILSAGELWVSGIPGNQAVTGGVNNLQVLPGLGRGISGILYVLGRAKASGYDIDPFEPLIQKGWEYCVERVLPQLQSGLYSGKEGVAVMMAAVEKSGLVDVSYHQVMKIANCFSTDAEELNIVNGIAGMGIALIECKAFIEEDKYTTLLDHYAFEIINSQEEDGSWESKDARGNISKQTGFEDGIAGMIYFMLEYCMESGNEDTWSCITKGLSYLEKHAIRSADKFQWYNSDVDKTIGGSWSTGAPGIALCFLKAYKLTGIAKYKHIAVKALNFHPSIFVHYNLSISNGLAGLGEIYLEAYEVLQSDLYLEKANWIADILIPLKNKTAGGNCYWHVENNICPAPDLMTGSSGIIHFLLRYRNSSGLSLPMLL